MRHLRLRQVLTAQGYTGKELREAVAFEHRNWKEDGESLPTVGQVRKMHVTLGTWDKQVEWLRLNFTNGDVENVLTIPNKYHIYPGDNYKPIKKVQEARWKEQEQRTEEFFNSMEV